MRRITLLLTIFSINIVQIFAQVPIENLKAEYLFNGNANDESGNNNDGQVEGATLTTDRFNNENSAYYFDGVDDFISLPSDFDYENRTICAWFNAESITTYNRIYDSNHAGLSYGKTTLITHNEGGVDKARMTKWGIDEAYNWNICKDSWYFMAKSIEGNTINYYLNGLHVGSFSGAYEKAVDGHNHAYIGTHREAASRFFHGKIDDVRIYDKALNEKEILALYAEEYVNTVYYDSIQVTDTLLIKVNIPTDIANPNYETTIKVYPNPSSEFVTVDCIDFDELSAYSLSIIDLTQKEVYNNTIVSRYTTIQTSEIGSKGLYFIRILNDADETVNIKKLIID